VRAKTEVVDPGRSALLTYEQLAAWLNTSVRHLRRLVDEGRIPFRKVGYFVRFDPGEISAWLDEHGNGAGRLRR
jgi:excisionase family DNA binding protein